MTMKRRMILAALVLGLVAGLVWFFRDTTPRTPLAAEVVGANWLGEGQWNVLCKINNLTSQPYVFLADVQKRSNEVWTSQERFASGQVPYLHIAAYSSTQIVRTALSPGETRVEIHYAKDKTMRQHLIDSLLRKLNLGPFYNDPAGGYVSTGATNLPAH